MIKLFFKYLMPLGIILTIGLVGYNYFLGTPEEQQQSKMIIGKVRDLGGEVFSLLHSEKEKYNAGKFDEAIGKVGSSITYLKDKAISTADGGQALLARLQELDRQKSALELQIANMTAAGIPDPNAFQGAGQNGAQFSTAAIDQLGAQLERLAAETQQVGMEMERR